MGHHCCKPYICLQCLDKTPSTPPSVRSCRRRRRRWSGGLRRS
uniref:Microtubule associated tumor suppressor candidate 2 n=1 Tax=Mus musculus TaxID=10090 RepID=D6RI77_MOUSE